ncbi:DUF3221 domain-containing protein [Bacillus horti]|uniref:DUF3221 domain-containing protein n=1 Tax=Caldalkalibacillus horti TaxID=77523 RepID=A0ABT9W3P5_9BACI|nr:DUF3221 domain-containing protein [Bacillus horti]MDQ0167876.1 hypothetical protein [Bacillus horti]
MTKKITTKMKVESKPLYYLLLLGLTIVLLAGCGTDGMSTGEGGSLDDTPYFEGMIYSIAEGGNSILVIQGIEHADIPQSEWQGKEAISFSFDEAVTFYDKEGNEITKDRLIKGQMVRVYHTGTLAESYPMQGRAIAVQIVD